MAEQQKSSRPSPSPSPSPGLPTATLLSRTHETGTARSHPTSTLGRPSSSTTAPLLPRTAISLIDSQISAAEMPQYTSRDVGDPSQIKKNKQSMADLKLRRLTELNNRLREDLERERIPVSQASKR